MSMEVSALKVWKVLPLKQFPTGLYPVNRSKIDASGGVKLLPTGFQSFP